VGGADLLTEIREATDPRASVVGRTDELRQQVEDVPEMSLFIQQPNITNFTRLEQWSLRNTETRRGGGAFVTV